MYKITLIKKLKFKENVDLSDEVKSFITALLKKNPEERLGSNGISEILNHPWLAGFDWISLINK